MKALTEHSLMARSLRWLAAGVCRHPGWFFWPQIALFGLCVVYSVLFLKADMNRDDLVGPNQQYHQTYLAFEKEFPQPNDLVVVVQSDDLEKNRQFVERIAAKLLVETNFFQDVFYQQSMAIMGDQALQFATTTDLVQTVQMLRTVRPFLEEFTQTTNLASLFEQINKAFRTAKQEDNAENQSLAQSLPALTRIVSQARDALVRPGVPPSPNVMTLLDSSGQALVANYLTFNHGRIFLVTCHAPNDDLTGVVVDRLRALVKETRSEVPGVNVGITGEPVLDYDEMTQSQKDATLASIVSLCLCAIIFIYGYSETGRPVKATICLLVGVGYTMAFTTATVGHLNILTITFVPMLIGLAMDYAVHLITRYEEELHHGKSNEEAITKAMVYTGQGIFTGALTTAGAFLAMYFTNFQGIKEMGVICGGGLLVCFIPMMTMLPVLLLRGRQNVLDHQIRADDRRARIENIWLQRPVLVAGIVATLCLVALGQARKVYFDYNLIKMQSPHLSSVVFEQTLLDSADKSLLYGAVLADSLSNAVAWQERIEKLPTVAGTEPPFYKDFLHPDEGEKWKLIGEVKAEVAGLNFKPPDMRPVNLRDLSSTLFYTSCYAGLAADTTGTNDPELTAQLVSLVQSITDLRKLMLDADAARQAEYAHKLAQFQQAFLFDLQDTFELLQRQDNTTPPTVANLPPALHHRFIGVNGKFLIQVYPKEDVWQRAAQEKFVNELRTVDKQVTGTPVQLYVYETVLKQAYVQAAWYSLAAIAIMVLIHFRSFSATILALIPVAIGTLWLAGLMGWMGVPINLANIMTLPLVIGIGVTNGIQILNRYAEEGTPGILSRSTGKAVLVSGLTAIAGFGSLILAQHRGIRSLGIIMATGIATCMIAALAFLPALLSLIARWRPLIKKPDVSKLPTPGPGGTEVKTSIEK
ncbi:MAG: MMPL family transporter [Verrucomicrobiota bacterium]|jgi:hopanoid biosynthesis associated RND transporter like protein HpnN